MAIGTTAAVIGGAALIGAGASIYGSRSAARAQSSAADRAAQSQLDAARIASNTQLEMFDTTRADAAPWMDAGQNALAALQFEMGLGGRPMVTDPNANPRLVARRDELRDTAANSPSAGVRASAERWLDTDRFTGLETPFRGFEATPGYAFQRDQGTSAIDASAAARGMLRSGATLKAQERFGQGIAAQEYNNYLNRLSGISGVGQASTGQIGALGTSVAGQIGNNALMGGQGAANSALAGGAARASAYNSMGSAINNLAGNALGAAAFGGYLSPSGGGNSWAGQYSSGWRP